MEYCTEIGPDGSGHKRCGAACIASALIALGWNSDPWGLTLEVTGKALGLSGPAPENADIVGGLTNQQLIDIVQGYGLSATTWMDMQQATGALKGGGVVLCMLDNWILRPRVYPDGSSWDALHIVRLVSIVDDVYALLYDPLCYMEHVDHPLPYQGPTVVTRDSLRLAISASPAVESGIIIWKPTTVVGR